MARLIYGAHAVAAALQSGRAQFVYIAPGDGAAKWQADAERAKIAHAEWSRADLDALTDGGVHQGVVAVTGEYVYAELDDMFAAAEARAESPLILVLDSVQNPHNLGALVRSATVLGAHGVVIAKDRSAQVNPTVVKTSAGSTERALIARVTNLSRALEELKERGVWTAGAIMENATRADAADLTVPLALVLGGEGPGLRPLTLRNCDLRVAIPMAPGGVGSLNVSVAGAILLYEARRQRDRQAAK